MSSDELTGDELAGVAQKAARGGMFLFIGNASATVILAVGAIITARLLDPSSYGSYSLVVAFPFLLASMADVGMISSLVRFPAKLRSQGEFHRSNRVIRVGFLFKLCMGMAASLICYGGASIIARLILNRPELTPLVQLASALIFFRAICDAAVYSFIGLDLMHLSGSIQVLQSILKSVLAPLLILIGFGVVGAVSGYVVSLAAAGIVGALLLIRHVPSKEWMRDSMAAELRVMLSYSLPLYVAMVLYVFLVHYQNIVLARFASDLEIGNFNAASNFNMLLMILGTPISGAMFPMFSKLDPETQRNELTKAFELSVKYVSLLMIPASVATMILSRELVYLTYGRGYVLAPSYLIVICSFYLLTALSYFVLAAFLNGVGDTMTMLKVNLLVLVVLLPLGPALAWPLGVYGLITAFVLANAVGTLYGLHKASVRLCARPNLRASLRILIAASAAAIPTILLLQIHLTGTAVTNLVIGGILYLITYLTLVPLIGALNRSDIDNLRTVSYRIAFLASLTKPILIYESWILSTTRRH